jgi:hypothetical protein
MRAHINACLLVGSRGWTHACAVTREAVTTSTTGGRSHEPTCGRAPFALAIADDILV